MIEAGTRGDLGARDHRLAILDVGFSSTRASCGLLVEHGEARCTSCHEPKCRPCTTTCCVTFAQAKECLTRLGRTPGEPINLVIEAPLSVAFTEDGNPTGRDFERHRDGRTRYWYVGLGASVMVAALCLIRHLAEAAPNADIRLFEGFASFKKAPTTHEEDVAALWHVIQREACWDECILHHPGDPWFEAKGTQVRSIGELIGVDLHGIPPVIVGHQAGSETCAERSPTR